MRWQNVWDSEPHSAIHHSAIIEQGLLLATGLEGSSRTKRIETILGHLQAVDLALASAKPGDLVMIQADTADETIQHLKEKHAAS